MRVFFVVIIIFMGAVRAYAQDSSGLYSKLYNLPDKFFGAVNNKSEKFQQKVIEATDKYLHKLSRQELKMQRLLARKDSAAAKKLFGNVTGRYDSLRAALKKPAAQLQQVYSGRLDSMTTMLKFLDQNKVLQSSALQSALKKYGDVQGKLNQTHFIQEELKERLKLLKENFKSFGKVKEFQQFQADVYYYRAQIDEYRKIFDQPKKLEATLLQLAHKIPAFNKFFSKYSQLGGLFRLPGNDDPSAVSIDGLQTRAMIMQELDQRLGSGPNTEGYVNQSIGNAQANLQGIKNKLNELGNNGGDGDLAMPDFKKNDQRTKSFLQRIEVGTNVQSTKGNSFLPITTDFGLSVGYKINSKSIIGIGTSYKMGWGRDIRHISISHEGIGLRSFYEFKLKGSFWITGGGEFNYRSSFNRIDQLKNYSAWQQSVLAGISKKYQVTKKFKGNAQLLYDFLHYRNVPRTQPVVFRVGYNLK